MGIIHSRVGTRVAGSYGDTIPRRCGAMVISGFVEGAAMVTGSYGESAASLRRRDFFRWELW